MLKHLDGFGCHLAGTLVGSNDTLCSMGVLDLKVKGRFWGRTTSRSLQLLI